MLALIKMVLYCYWEVTNFSRLTTRWIGKNLWKIMAWMGEWTCGHRCRIGTVLDWPWCWKTTFGSRRSNCITALHNGGLTLRIVTLDDLGDDVRASMSGARWLLLNAAQLDKSTPLLMFTELDDILVAVDHRGTVPQPGIMAACSTLDSHWWNRCGCRGFSKKFWNNQSRCGF